MRADQKKRKEGKKLGISIEDIHRIKVSLIFTHDKIAEAATVSNARAHVNNTPVI